MRAHMPARHTTRRQTGVRAVAATLVAGLTALALTVVTSEGVIHAFTMPHA
jgi:hypothetical protein